MSAPIPALCAGRPTTPEGLVMPWASQQLDGSCSWTVHQHPRWRSCWLNGLCQVCGRPTGSAGEARVLFGGPLQLQRLLFTEPPLHPACAIYTARSCPMIAGEQEAYTSGTQQSPRTVYLKTDDEPETEDRDPNHDWFAVYVRACPPAITPNGQVYGGLAEPGHVIRVRQVSAPGERFDPWRPVPDWLDRYTPPRTLEAPIP